MSAYALTVTGLTSLFAEVSKEKPYFVRSKRRGETDILWAGRYYTCNDWEMRMIRDGATPADLGMFPMDEGE